MNVRGAMRKAGTVNPGEDTARLLRPAWLFAALMLALLPYPIAAEPNEKIGRAHV